jgi:hypothetical protein
VALSLTVELLGGLILFPETFNYNFY